MPRKQNTAKAQAVFNDAKKDRRFSGRTYQKAFATFSKTEAEKVARRSRKQGINARIVSKKNPYGGKRKAFITYVSSRRK